MGSKAPQNRMVEREDRKSTRLNSSHVEISYAVFCLKKKKDKDGNEEYIVMKYVKGQTLKVIIREEAPFPAEKAIYIVILFFFNDTATTEIYTLSLHDALPISPVSLPPGADRDCVRSSIAELSG